MSPYRTTLRYETRERNPCGKPVLIGGVFGLLIMCVMALSGCHLRSLLSDASVSPGVISPNADGVDDATNITYRLSRNASLSIYFESASGGQFFFRQDRPRSAGEYRVQWGGVIKITAQRGAASCSRIAAAVSGPLALRKGFTPVSISYQAIPNEEMSGRRSRGLRTAHFQQACKVALRQLWDLLEEPEAGHPLVAFEHHPVEGKQRNED